MSIIFEALKKIEEEKREDPLGGPPVVPGLLGEKSATEPRRISGARINTAAAVVAGVSLIVLSALYFRPRMPGDATKPPAAPPPHRAGATASTKPAMEEVRLKPRSILPAVEGFSPETLQPAFPRSPAAAPPPEARLPDLRLRGLSRSGSRSWAIINDRMLKVGDTVEGAEVVEILSDRVKLKNGGTVFTLTY